MNMRDREITETPFGCRIEGGASVEGAGSQEPPAALDRRFIARAHLSDPSGRPTCETILWLASDLMLGLSACHFPTTFEKRWGSNTY
jgi:hypothetical protein